MDTGLTKVRDYGVRLRALFAAFTAPLPMRDFADYDAYWEERGDLNTGMRRWELAAGMIPDGATVLDVGCGSGEFLTFLRNKRPHIQATGADFSPVAVRHTRDRGFDAYELDLSIQDIPDKYDYITCFEVLEHIPEAEVAAARLAAAARYQILLSMPNVGSVFCRVRLGVFGRFPNTNCIFHVKEHVRHWTVTDFREWAPHCGLRVVRVEGQYGLPELQLWRRLPGLFATGLFYVLEPATEEAP